MNVSIVLTRLDTSRLAQQHAQQHARLAAKAQLQSTSKCGEDDKVGRQVVYDILAIQRNKVPQA